jgi:nucleotide-binding universal stress UspA family protein
MPGIVVGIDGSAHSAQALEWAIKEGALQHAAVTVVTVNSVPASPWTGNPFILAQDPAVLGKMRQAAEEMTVKTTSQLGEARPTSVTVRAINGFPAKELIDASRDADLLVVGSRGAGGFARLLMGSVSDQVAHHAHCPVMVVRS